MFLAGMQGENPLATLLKALRRLHKGCSIFRGQIIAIIGIFPVAKLYPSFAKDYPFCLVFPLMNIEETMFYHYHATFQAFSSLYDSEINYINFQCNKSSLRNITPIYIYIALHFDSRYLSSTCPCLKILLKMIKYSKKQKHTVPVISIVIKCY